MFSHNYLEDVKSLSSEKPNTSIAINLIGTDALKEWQENLTPNHQLWVEVNGFKAKHGQVLIL